MEKVKLLVIDDNQPLIKMVKEYFEKKNDISVILEANNGEEGIEIIKTKQEKFNLILLDIT